MVHKLMLVPMYQYGWGGALTVAPEGPVGPLGPLDPATPYDVCVCTYVCVCVNVVLQRTTVKCGVQHIPHLPLVLGFHQVLVVPMGRARRT